jgi:hypothetical protein
VAAACHDQVYASSIDSSFTVSDDENGAASLAFGNVMAYLVETSIVAKNPTFSGDGSSHQWAAAIAVFTSATGGGGGGMKCYIGGGYYRTARGRRPRPVASGAWISTRKTH